MRMSVSKLSVFFIVIAATVVAIAVVCWPDANMASRDIGCVKAPPGRRSNICNALSAGMEWTWLGHAIVSPGWRLTWAGLRRVYCQENITAGDLPVLESLKKGLDWRLQDGADGLIRLISSGGGHAEPENSIFNPQNPNYILKNGCDRLR